MILTQKEFAQAMAQINVAFEVANEKIDKLELEVKELKAKQEKPSADTKKGKSKG
jgi:outer membrane murein-binding lipoprotein Lpp